MPIGKNAIKRVTNNGYSNVKASAPDMENSVVTEEKPPVVEEKKVVTKKQPTKKTPAQVKASATKEKKAQPTPKKSMEKEPELSPVKTLEKVTKKPARTQKRKGDGYINIGGELPYYLL